MGHEKNILSHLFFHYFFIFFVVVGVILFLRPKKPDGDREKTSET